MGAVKRADWSAAFDRWCSLSRGLCKGAEQHEASAAVMADLSTCRPGGPIPFADLVFSGTLYVDMVPERVPVLWGAFSSAVGEWLSLDIEPSPVEGLRPAR